MFRYVLVVILIVAATAAFAQPLPTAKEVCATPVSPQHPDEPRQPLSPVRYIDGHLVNCSEPPRFCEIERQGTYWAFVTKLNVENCEAQVQGD